MTTIEGADRPAATPADPGPEALSSPAPALAVPAAEPDTSAPQQAPADARKQALQALALGVTLLGVFLLGFAAYLFGLSAVQEARSQTVLYETLAGQLATGIAPLGPTELCNPNAVATGGVVKMCPTPAGTPMAILDIPSIGVRDLVVVYGTSPEALTLGPGLVRNSPLPGQGGVSVIYGRRATYGAPFARLGGLHNGDIIKVTTGQGISRYSVVAFGSSSRQIQDPSPNRLVLLTAGSATVPTYYDYVDAVLASTVKPEPGGLPAIYSSETALSGDGGALVDTLLWALALAIVSGSATIGATRWKPWPTYLAAAPLVLLVLWNLYQSLAALLPNVY